jgi:hypothetical protein
MTRRLLCATALTAACAALPVPSANGDGLPVLGIDVGTKGVASAQVRYVTLQDGGNTLVARTAVAGGRVLRYTRVAGWFTIPAVAYDGTASGLSADGGTLVLIEPRKTFPRTTTRFAVLDARRLALARRITLHGDFSFDAVSPDGTTAYLIQYLGADPNRYRVRALDLRTGRLEPRAVVDPREAGEAMRGAPITRAAGSSGRWAYTLYDGAGETPFLHALDTVHRAARCIDLPMLAGRQDLGSLRLHVGGRYLSVVSAARTLALVDTAGFRVTEPLGR